jgi:hypothetical protein
MVMVIAFLHSPTALNSSLFCRKSSAARVASAGLAWAEESPAMPISPLGHQEVQTTPTSSLSPSKEKNPQPSAGPAKPGEVKPVSESPLGHQEVQTSPTNSLSPSEEKKPQPSIGPAKPAEVKPVSESPLEHQEVQTSPTNSLSPSEEKKPEPSIGTAKPAEVKPELGFVDTLHGQLSRKLLSTAEWLDSFFADANYVKEENQSYVRFRYDFFKEEYAPAVFKPAFDLRLALPELERRTHIAFSAAPSETLTGPGTPVLTPAERFGEVEQANFTTALQYFFKTTPKENFIVMSGVQFSKFKPVPLVEPRYRLLFPFPIWKIRFTQEVLWRTDTAWQMDSRLEFERQLPKDLFFRTTIDGVWASRVLGYTYSLAFLLREPFDQTHAVDYEWINTWQTRPVDELTEIDFRIRYRHSFWREWLFFEVSPQVRFPQSNNFDIIPGILFRLEMFFGRIVG